MSFLTPAFFIGLGAIAIPVLVHLIQREKKRVVTFPSLMFVRRIPYQSVRRRRIRHWFLLFLRAAAIALIVLAFARPFTQPSASTPAAALAGARDVVIVLDQSASMGYGDHFEKAKDAARGVVRTMSGEDRGTLVLFGKNAEENMRATSDRARLEGAINAAKVTSGATRYGPALKLAESILSRSPLKRREAVLISDFQKTGWSGSEDARFPDGTTLTTVSVASGPVTNVSVPSVSFGRTAFSGQERIAVTAGISNKGDDKIADVPVTLTVEGHDIETLHAAVGPRASSSVTFTPFTLSGPNVRGDVRAGSDPMPADNTFNFVLSPSEPVSILVIDSGGTDSSLFIAKALSIGTTPQFHVDVVPASRFAPGSLDKRAVVIVNDTQFPPGAAGGALKRFVERGGGLLIVAGDHTTWPAAGTSGSPEADLLPGKLGAPVDRTDSPSGAFGFLDYSHAVFEIFKAPRSGDFSAAHIYRYRALEPAQGDRVLARYDDGAVAAAERKVGNGRVVVWTSTLDDSFTDIGVKPIFLPLVHQLTRYLARYEQPASWFTVGQVLDLSARAKNRNDRVIVSPSGARATQQAAKGSADGSLELLEQGIYEVRNTGANVGKAEALAVNLDPAESDLAPLDPRELVASVTGHATAESEEPSMAQEMTREEAEKRQSLWWYLLMSGVVLLGTETLISNHLSRKEKFL
ncbi:MAG TPA: BatA and WFA domain-containing protein [Vicinamibacterales bacterium]|nr:BatA and WFA domain-containing protein [Vicinamibacterales bacterium]